MLAEKLFFDISLKYAKKTSLTNIVVLLAAHHDLKLL